MSAARMEDRIALVAGGASGVGRETALGLARLGATVAVAGADAARGGEAVDAIRRESGNPAVHLLAADLSSLEQVRRMAERFGAAYPRLDLLVNAALPSDPRREETEDGIERVMAAAHLSPALLTHLLLPMLGASVPARIVNVSRGVSRWTRATDGRRRAGLLNLLWTRELARRLRGTGITVVSAAAGRTLPAPFGLPWPILRHVSLREADEQAARAVLVAATSRELVSGTFLDRRGNPVRPPRAVRDGEAALRAWETTAERLGIPLERFGATRVAKPAARRGLAASRVPRSAWGGAVYRETSLDGEAAAAA